MTREEKINTLKAIIQECEEYQWQRKETLFEIIKDLEQEPTTKNDLGVDAISRADSIKAMQNKAKELKNEDTINGLCGGMTREEVIKIIRKMLAYTDLTVRANLNADMVNACNFAIKALEQEPKAEIALNRYRDLQDYFSDEAVAKTILENQTEFKSWLERLKWNTKKVDELARKLEALEQKSILDKVKQAKEEIENLTPWDDGTVEMYEVLEILDKLIESEG